MDGQPRHNRATCRRQKQDVAARKPSGVARVKSSDKAGRQQLDRILASKTFSQVERLKRFVNFIVREAISGRGGELKEYVIGVEVFGKEPSFDPRTDPIVRVQARRLRSRLVRYYREEGQADELIIDLPKGGYTPVFRRREGCGHHASVAHHHAGRTQHGGGAALRRSHGRRVDAAFLRRAARRNRARPADAQDLARAGGAVAMKRRMRRPRRVSDAALIVGGSVRASGDRLRVATQLVDGASGCYLWSDVDRRARRRMRLPRRRPSPRRSSRSSARRSPTENCASARGRPATTSPRATSICRGDITSISAPRRDCRRPSSSSEGAGSRTRSSRSRTAGWPTRTGCLTHYGVLGPADVWAPAAASAAAAVALDGHSAEAHTSVAHVRATQDWDWAGAERAFQRAIQLNPRYPTAHHWYAMSCLVPLGRLDEALEQMLIAQSLDPVSSIIARDVAGIYSYRRDFEAALEQCDQTIELNPHFAPAYMTLGLIQEQRRVFDESAAAFRRAVDLAPQTPRMQGALARTLALSGKADQAREILATLADLGRERYVSPFEFLTIHFALGEMEQGYDWLARACGDRCFELLAINVDFRFDQLRSDARFVSVARRVGLTSDPHAA